MRFSFDKAACQNTRRALRKEWLLTNGLGGYASSSILYCNTRKYHGLLVIATPDGRQVLLSAMEESLFGGGKEFPISTRQHPGVLHPSGHQYLEKFTLDPWPQFTYRVSRAAAAAHAPAQAAARLSGLSRACQGKSAGADPYRRRARRLCHHAL